MGIFKNNREKEKDLVVTGISRGDRHRRNFR
jgi:hypothetical protein